MDLQQNVLENGVWVTRTVQPRELLEQRSVTQAKTRQQPSQPPTYGVLTKTVIESPLIQWILPVQLRSSRNNDVAFLGEHFIQIRELGPDLRLRDIARKQDFGSRIRNARVIGSPTTFTSGQGKSKSAVGIKQEDEDVEMIDPDSNDPQSTGHNQQFPPQFLALVLEHGELVFLYLKETPAGRMQFVTKYYTMKNRRAGFQIAVDPSSHYMALSCPENLLFLYELESFETLRSRHAEGRDFSPVKSFKSRAVRGVILKIEFLFPKPDDEYHVILMLMLSYDQKLRLATYDWDQGNGLGTILAKEKTGIRLGESWQVPLMVVPLTVNNSFLLVAEGRSAIFSGILEGPPQEEPFDLGALEQSEHHLGERPPLWVAWARPSREKEYHRKNDTIYLAREDGILKILDESLKTGFASTPLRKMNCSVDTAFGVMDDGKSGDILIAGGSCGPGEIWHIRAREQLRCIGSLPNWSPAQDMVTTYACANKQLHHPKAKHQLDLDDDQMSTPDRIFACTGRGKAGSIVEFRHGLEANIRLEYDLGVPVKHCWALAVPQNEVPGLYLLFALPDRSYLLHLEEGFLDMADPQAEERLQEQVSYDLSARTLAVHEFDDTTVQVTENSITIMNGNDSARYTSHELDGGSSVNIVGSAMRGRVVALAIYSGSRYHVRALTVEGISINHATSFEVEGEVTCVALANFADHIVLIAGVWTPQGPLLTIYPTDKSHTFLRPLPLNIDFLKAHSETDDDDSELFRTGLEALTSIAVIQDRHERIDLAVGTRSGVVGTLKINFRTPDDLQIHFEKFGLSATHVFPLSAETEPASVFVCSNSGLAVMTNYIANSQPFFQQKSRVWLVNGEKSTLPALAIDSVARLSRNFSNVTGNLTVLMVSGSTTYICDLSPEPKPVLRYLQTDGEPNKIMYSRYLEVLVAAANENGVPSLHFIDPDTGLDLSYPYHEKHKDVAHITGLGDEGTRILALTSWRYTKDNNTWEYIVVSVETRNHEGRILLVSANKHHTTLEPGAPARIRFFTKQNVLKFDQPVYSMAPAEEGFFFCAGTMVHYKTIDQNKKLQPAKKFELPSAASWMEVVEEKLHVVTIQHSLIVLDYKSDPQTKTMTQVHTDDTTKLALHCIEAGGDSRADPSHAITLLSDIMCGIWGLWVPPRSGNSLKTIFAAELRASVRRFARSRTRPPWDFYTRRAEYASVGSGDGSEIIGLSLDGSLLHFTLLHVDAWRLLKFLQDLAYAAPFLCTCPSRKTRPEYEDEPQSRPVTAMQVDGDILQRCLDKRALEQLLVEPHDAAHFRILLEALDQGRYTQGFEAQTGMAPYIGLGYEVLRYYLAPVL